MHKADAFCDFLRMRNNAASLNETDSIRHIIEHSIFHAYAVCALGTICNFAALWCIVTCDKTNAAVKFLLFCIFLSLLLLSLLTRPLLSLNMSTFLKEDVKPVPEVLNVAVCILYILLAEGEMWCIAAVAFFRGSAIWSARRRKLTLSAAVKVVAFLYVFIILSNFVQRNKRQLLSVDGKPSPTLDRATHAIMAVLILNLAIGLPHTVYHFLPTTTVQEDIFFHTLFSCHFFVDPVVFLGFNRSYRNRITGVLCACVSRVLGICAKAMPVHDAQGRMRDEFFHTHVQGAAENVEMAVQIRDTHRPSDET
ncbi:uncharacterized protein [Macrobrachium rosenbergii]|uniref:uncharacterized protein isoform X2 n=1 Tax=Macrobrachium rosenbergii TaxID=79674 RepID=UPI0034D4AFC8